MNCVFQHLQRFSVLSRNSEIQAEDAGNAVQDDFAIIALLVFLLVMLVGFVIYTIKNS